MYLQCLLKCLLLLYYCPYIDAGSVNRCGVKSQTQHFVTIFVSWPNDIMILVDLLIIHRHRAGVDLDE